MPSMNSNALKDLLRLPLLPAAAGVSALAAALAVTSGCVVAVRPAPPPVVY
jgi:hypothetical protein